MAAEVRKIEKARGRKISKKESLELAVNINALAYAVYELAKQEAKKKNSKLLK